MFPRQSKGSLGVTDLRHRIICYSCLLPDPYGSLEGGEKESTLVPPNNLATFSFALPGISSVSYNASLFFNSLSCWIFILFKSH